MELRRLGIRLRASLRLLRNSKNTEVHEGPGLDARLFRFHPGPENLSGEDDEGDPVKIGSEQMQNLHPGGSEQDDIRNSHEELQGHVATYTRNRTLLLDALPALGLSEIAPPDGAFYVYADIRHLTDDSMAFCKRLLNDTGVATAPGIDFDPVDGHRFIRFCYAGSNADMREAVDRIGRWLAR